MLLSSHDDKRIVSVGLKHTHLNNKKDCGIEYHRYASRDKIQLLIDLEVPFISYGLVVHTLHLLAMNPSYKENIHIALVKGIAI